MKSVLNKVFEKDGVVLVAVKIDESDILVAKAETIRGEAPHRGNWCFQSPEFRYELVPSPELVAALKELNLYDDLNHHPWHVPEEDNYIFSRGCHTVDVNFERMRSQPRKEKKTQKANDELDRWMKEDKEEWLANRSNRFAENLTSQIREVMSGRAHSAAKVYIKNGDLDSKPTRALKEKLEFAREVLEEARRTVNELEQQARDSKVADRLEHLGELNPEVEDLLKEKMYYHTRYSL